MPHINRIRVNNVKYNFGTQFYDDFMMRFSCKNTIYDLANGGGKSVLMLLLLQNLIPNCTLDDKQPIEKLFRTNEGSSVIHSMIEWRLSDVHVKDGFKYMLTGFCARKAKDQEEEGEIQQKNGASIEYFNYCIFYRNFNDNDIKNFPLSNNGERVTFTGLKNYLKSLQKNDFNLDVKIFERKGDYQRFIAEYGLYESEWEIIRGINKTEGHVRTYFETNYKTTRKVVEDLLIEEIIEKSFKNKYSEDGSEDSLAETLLNIKDKLLELSEKKEEINNYDHQIEIIDGFIERVNSILKLYSGIEDAFLQLKKVYNSIEEAEFLNSNELEKAKTGKEEVLAEKNNIALKVDTAKVLVDMKEVERLDEKYNSEVQKLEAVEEEIQGYIDKLNLLEGGNYYLEYIRYKKEYDKLKLIMDNILKDNSVIINNLKELTAAKKVADEDFTVRISEEIERETVSAKKEADNLKELMEENTGLENRIAIAGYQVETDEKKINEIESRISEKKSHTSLLLPTDARKMLNEVKKKEESLDSLFSEYRLKRDEAGRQIIEYNVLLNEKKFKLSEAEKEKEKIVAYQSKMLNSFEKLKKIKEVYGESEVDRLITSVSKIYRNMVSSINDINAEIRKKEKEIQTLELGKPFVESEMLDEVLEYIRRYHCKNAITGLEFLAELPPEKREAVLNLNPVIPYSIIVPENFSQVAFDVRIKEIVGTSNGIIIVNGQGIEFDTDEVMISSNVSFVAGEVIFEPEKIFTKINKAKAELDELNKTLLRKSENEQVVREDYIFLLSVKSKEELMENPEENKAKLCEEIKDLLEEINSIKENLSKAKKYEEQTNEEITDLMNQMKNIKEETAILSEIDTLLNEFAEVENNIKRNRQIKIVSEKELKDGKARYEAMENMYRQRQIRISAKKEMLDNISLEWKEKYNVYFDENIYNSLKSNPDKMKAIMTEDLDVKLNALLESMKKDNAQVSDKEKLLNNYQTSMERNLSHIDYMGGDVRIFENLYRNNELVNTSNVELSRIKNSNIELRDKEKELRRGLTEIRSERDKLQGKINHEIAGINEKYGEFNKDLIRNEEIHTFLNENESILSELEKKNSEFSLLINECEKRGINLSVLKRDVTRLMTKSNVKPEKSAGVLEQGKDVDKACKEVSEKLDGFIEEKFKRSEVFEKEVSLLTDTLKKLNAHELASEIRINVSMPSNLAETRELMDMLKETNDFIELEKQRVIRGLDDMQIIKDNFENQCIQSCVNIKTELDRLSKLSKITMDNETIPVINLKIPYVKEEAYKERMSEYIDRVAKATDQYESSDEKLKFIRNNLCWKKMFSVIVTDMNAIRLNLYKRERIADQSRFLPYEEAVGSTGQSQGIYIQFLISIINYISSINSRNADASRLKKVIFIDNPFGAAKDVYIWEPIFKLLKANNVQLVVPARGATPAISGRFDVNYVLGQKMCEGRQQTVVVDYFSNVNNDELDYTTLAFEQTALF